MIDMRNEAAAQGLDRHQGVGLLAGLLHDKFKAAGSAVEGTYTWMQFLPFEDEGSNEELDNYLASVETPDSFGAQAWMAAVLFQDAVNDIVESDGPNAITRASTARGVERDHVVRRQRMDGCQEPEGRVLGLHGRHPGRGR